eukprot:scaffold5707_cov112-Cylindrotheca_fusiformis.AAC.5
MRWEQLCGSPITHRLAKNTSDPVESSGLKPEFCDLVFPVADGLLATSMGLQLRGTVLWSSRNGVHITSPSLKSSSPWRIVRMNVRVYL